MKSKKDPSLIAARLTTAVSSQENPEDRIDALAKFISGYKPDEIGHVIGSVIVDACQNIEAALTFLSLLFGCAAIPTMTIQTQSEKIYMAGRKISMDVCPFIQ